MVSFGTSIRKGDKQFSADAFQRIPSSERFTHATRIGKWRIEFAKICGDTAGKTLQSIEPTALFPS
jgi:hypothetical protein